MISLMLGVICFAHARRQQGVEAEVVGLVANCLSVFFFTMAFLVGI